MSGLNSPIKPLVLAVALASHEAYACNSPYSITKTNDDVSDQSTLSGAISHMNSNCAGQDTQITINDSIAGTTIQLGESYLYASTNSLVTIEGPIDNPVTLQSTANGEGHLQVEGSTSLTIKNLIMDGNDHGATAITLHEGGSNIISIENSTLQNFKSRAITIDRANVNITDSHFVNNSTSATTASGGAIYIGSDSTLTISDTRFENNSSGSSGGAIYIQQTEASISGSTFKGNSTNPQTSLRSGGAISAYVSDLTVSESTFQNNQAKGSGGAIDFGGDANIEELIISDSVFEGNSAISSGGAINQITAAYVSIKESTFTENSVIVNEEDQNNSGINISGHGGAVHSYQTKALDIEGSTFTSNTAENLGGALYIDSNWTTEATLHLNIVDSTFESNTTTINATKNTVAHGGAIALASSTETAQGVVTINNVTLNNNAAAGDGGAVYSEDTPYDNLQINIVNSSLSGNQAEDGGGILVEGTNALSVTSSLIHNNTATGHGSALYIRGNYGSGEPSLQLVNSTVSDNTAQYGTIVFSGVHGENSYIKHSTIHNNTSNSGAGAVYGNGVSSDDAIVISHSIISNNTGPNGQLCQLGEANYDFALDHTFITDGDTSDSCRSNLDNGGNLIGSTIANDILDAELGELQNNGGSTLTYLPASTSPVVNAGDANIENAPNLDQRGNTRIQEGVIDIGAVETGLPVQEDDDDGFLGLGSLNYLFLSIVSLMSFRRNKK